VTGGREVKRASLTITRVGAAVRGSMSHTMPRRLFTLPSVLSLLLCAGTGVAYVGTMRMSLYNPGPGLTVVTVPWLGWACVFFAAATVGLLLRQARRIRTWDERRRGGLCPNCGYDLRATPGRCPECGSESHLVRQPPIL
jgi:hypothetical protein